jgi:hypothetical protein
MSETLAQFLQRSAEKVKRPASYDVFRESLERNRPAIVPTVQESPENLGIMPTAPSEPDRGTSDREV